MSNNSEPIIPDLSSDFFNPFSNEPSDLNVTPIDTHYTNDTLDTLSNDNVLDVTTDTSKPLFHDESKPAMVEAPVPTNSNVDEIPPFISNNEVDSPKVNLNDLLNEKSTEEITATHSISELIEMVPDVVNDEILGLQNENKDLKSKYQTKSKELSTLLSGNKTIFEEVTQSSEMLISKITEIRNALLETLQNENATSKERLKRLDTILETENKKKELYSQKLAENKKKAEKLDTILRSLQSKKEDLSSQTYHI